MLALIAIAVFAVLELYVMVLVADAIGALNTVGLIILFSLAGVWLAKLEGLSVLSRIRGQLDAGRVPTDELIEGGLVLTGGLLLIVPGFVTDALGLVLLFPLTRSISRRILRRRFRLRVYGYDVGRHLPGRDDGPDDVIDV